jgi:isoquinoline 1-oxidoreductase alpha subunit
MIMAAAALVRDKPKCTDADIDAAMTNICRCGTYNRVRKAIHVAVRGGDPASAGLAIERISGSKA